MKKYLRYLLSLSPSALLHLAVIRATGKEYLVSGSCKGCGQCCERINLRNHAGWIRHEHQFQAMLNRLPGYRRFSISGLDKYGYLQFTCSKFKNGYGCTDYANRPDICKRYPNESLFLQGGQLVEGCGYVIRTGTPFARHLTAAIKKRRNGV